MSDAGREGGQPAAPPQPPRNGDAEEHYSGPIGTIKTVAFIVAIQLFALYITHVNAPVVAASGYSYAPAGTSSGGSITNVLILDRLRLCHDSRRECGSSASARSRCSWRWSWSARASRCSS